jgi:outer membrane protein OmpA-like peptidoglycan-associated protein/tetratricopeptide (TPR) repeat protein
MSPNRISGWNCQPVRKQNPLPASRIPYPVSHIQHLVSLLLLFLLLYHTCFGQQPGYQFSTSSKKASKAFNSALQAYEARDHQKALEEVNYALKEDSLFCEAIILKGDLLSDEKNPSEAIALYKKVLRINPGFSNNLYFICGGLELYLGRYSDAETDYLRYLEGKNVPDIKKKKALAQIANARFGRDAMAHPVPFEPINLGDSVNTANAEYINAISTDAEVLYFTRKIPRSEKSEDLKGDEEDFFFSLSKDGVNWRKARNLGPPVNTGRNEGALNISPDGRYLFFAGCDRPDGFGSCDIYWSRKAGNAWSEPENLGERVNSPAWDSQPSFSSDGKTLFFASKRPGGKGSSDIWKTELKADGTWSIPVNLGDSVNTPYEEMTPFIHGDGRTLYFASKGHPGMGGFDMFICRRTSDSAWSKSVNLGYPINTSSDEMALIVNSKGNLAYISSDKFGGKGLQDIYSFPLYREVQPVPSTYMKGVVFDAETKRRLGANFELFELPGGKLVSRAASDPLTGEFIQVLPTDRDYALNVSRDGYLFYSDNFSLRGSHSADKPFIKNIDLKPIRVGEVIVLKNIFFDTDKYILKPESVVELQILLALLRSNPSVKAELGGHTDNQGSASHNLELSRNRAKAVYEFLISNGIHSNRLSYEGFGMTRPIDSNDTEQGRANNRRTELKVTGK